MLCHLYITLGTMSVRDLVLHHLRSCFILSVVYMLCHLYITLGTMSMRDLFLSSLKILLFSEWNLYAMSSLYYFGNHEHE